MTKKLYLRSKKLSCTSKIVDLTYKPFVGIVLNETIFHPQGGGQKGDQGSIGGKPILDTKSLNEKIYHIVENFDGLEINTVVQCDVDSDWRQQNSRLHSSGHLIASIVETLYPNLKAIKGHHWPNESKIEFQGDCRDLVALKESAQNEIERAISIPLTSKIEYNEEGVRVSKIGDYQATPCGGTHVCSTSELEGLKITKVNLKKGVIRVSYIIN